MQKKNILFLINNLGGGGAEKVLVNLVNNMDKSKYNITLKTLVDQGVNKKFLSNDIKYEYVYKNGFRGTKYLYLLPKKYIYNKVVNGQFDVIVVYLQGVLTKIIANAPSSQKTIAYMHGDVQEGFFVKSFKSIEKFRSCFKTYDAIVSVSKSVENSFKSVYGIDEKLYVKYNTFDVKAIEQKSNENIECDISVDGFIKLCAVGTLKTIKGFDRLIKVLARLKIEGNNFILNIIGDGPEKSYLQRLVIDNKLEDNVFLKGFKSNPYKYISQSDLFISASHTEGFSSVVVESIILGVPVVTTDCAGMSEILGKNNEYGIIVKNDEDGLYNGLKSILIDTEILQHYKNKAKERAAFFSTENSVLEVEHLIDNIIAS